MYTENDLVSVARRENNTKRNYLVVDPLQGKHVPVSPGRSLELFDELAKKVKESYPDEKILFIGFAETATAIGSRVAVYCSGKYIQTTRENIENVGYLYFTEAHSHATEQKLVKEDIESVINDVDRVVFVEDEVTTGNTILNIVRIMRQNYGDIRFGVASLLNGMSEEYLKSYGELGIDLHFLVKTVHGRYPAIADGYVCDGKYFLPDFHDCGMKGVEITDITGGVNARRLTDGRKYEEAVMNLWKNLSGKIDIAPGKSYLVMGTEECMYPTLSIGAQLEKMGCVVRTHSTTRSPILVSNEDGYPLKNRYELRSLYDDERVTFIYDIGHYDEVIVITDADLSCRKGLLSLINAIRKNNGNCGEGGNETGSENVTGGSIRLVRWCK